MEERKSAAVGCFRKRGEAKRGRPDHRQVVRETAERERHQNNCQTSADPPQTGFAEGFCLQVQIIRHAIESIGKKCHPFTDFVNIPRNLPMYRLRFDGNLMEVVATAPSVTRLTRDQIEARLRTSKPIPSLHRISDSLKGLLAGEQHYTSQISGVIRRDPSLSSRMLHLANSVYFGLATPVQTIEEAVLYLGMQQIRQLALITPIVEDFQKLCKDAPFTWREFWQHCIGTAVMTREIAASVNQSADESAYLAGLLHDVGRILNAAVFPDHFIDIYQCCREVVQDQAEVETYVLGMDHGELGALYFQMHKLPGIFVETARHHHAPERAEQHQKTVAAVQVADLLIRHAKIGASGDTREVSLEDAFNASGWKILFPEMDPAALKQAQTRTKHGLERLPIYLAGLI